MGGRIGGRAFKQKKLVAKFRLSFVEAVIAAWAITYRNHRGHWPGEGCPTMTYGFKLVSESGLRRRWLGGYSGCALS